MLRRRQATYCWQLIAQLFAPRDLAAMPKGCAALAPIQMQVQNGLGAPKPHDTAAHSGGKENCDDCVATELRKCSVVDRAATTSPQRSSALTASVAAHDGIQWQYTPARITALHAVQTSQSAALPLEVGQAPAANSQQAHDGKPHSAGLAAADSLLSDVLVLLGKPPPDTPCLQTPAITPEASAAFFPSAADQQTGAQLVGDLAGVNLTKSHDNLCRVKQLSLQQGNGLCTEVDAAATALVCKCLQVHYAAEQAISQRCATSEAAVQAVPACVAASSQATAPAVTLAPHTACTDADSFAQCSLRHHADETGACTLFAPTVCSKNHVGVQTDTEPANARYDAAKCARPQAEVAELMAERDAAIAAVAAAETRCERLTSALAERREAAAAAAAAIDAQRHSEGALHAHIAQLECKLAALEKQEVVQSMLAARHATQLVPFDANAQSRQQASHERGTAASMRALMSVLDSARTRDISADAAAAQLRRQLSASPAPQHMRSGRKPAVAHQATSTHRNAAVPGMRTRDRMSLQMHAAWRQPKLSEAEPPRQPNTRNVAGMRHTSHACGAVTSSREPSPMTSVSARASGAETMNAEAPAPRRPLLNHVALSRIRATLHAGGKLHGGAAQTREHLPG